MTGTSDLNKETEKMEVHHHSNSHGKKNVKVYLWEFIMLFLAVFCGFLAENQRENMVEKKRERQYIRTLIGDINTDLDNLMRIITEYSSTTVRLDTMLNQFDAFTDNFLVPASRSLFYITYHHDDFTYTDRTM